MARFTVCVCGFSIEFETETHALDQVLLSMELGYSGYLNSVQKGKSSIEWF